MCCLGIARRFILELPADAVAVEGPLVPNECQVVALGEMQRGSEAAALPAKAVPGEVG